MLLAIMGEPCDFVEVVVRATGYREGGELLHISKVARRRRILSHEHLLNNPIWDPKYYLHLYYMMTCVIMRLKRWLHTQKAYHQFCASVHLDFGICCGQVQCQIEMAPGAHASPFDQAKLECC